MGWKSSHLAAVFLNTMVFLAVFAGCNQKGGGLTRPEAGKVTLKPSTAGADQSNSGRPKPLTTQEALHFIKDNCGECHSPGKALYASFGLPEDEQLLKDTTWLEGHALNQTAYQTLVNKLLAMEQKVDDLGKPPQPMPPSFKSEEESKKLGSMVAWFQDTFPQSVKEAHVRFGEDAPFRALVQVDLSYKCQQLINGQEFLARFSSKALGSVSGDQFETYVNGILSAEEKAAPADENIRKKVVDAFLVTPPDNLRESFRSKFEEVTIKALAQRIANAGAIETRGANVQPAVTSAQRRDLQNEFYQLVKAEYLNVSYPQLFLLNKVKVTSNTAGLYENCTAPQPNMWGECTLSSQRANYFGTRGFLLSKPTSMLENNNNYGRGGDTFSTIFGEVLMANTDGVSGEAPKPIPACLNVTKDKRWKYKVVGQKEGMAAWGAIAIPFYGRICQGCHLNRHLAAASVVFRPFGLAGEVIQPTDIRDGQGRAKAPYAALIQLDSVAEDKKFQVFHTDDKATVFSPVNQQFYLDLLSELSNPEATCLPDPRNPQDTTRAVKTNTLAKYAETLIYQNDSATSKVKGTAAVRGLNRFLPSLFLNAPKTNLEVISAVNSAFENNEGKLEPMLRAFFTTQTFACSSK
jgi:hypothetical protein